MSDKPLKILVVGCGSIGRRHIRLLKEMGVDVGAYDVDKNTRNDVMKDLTMNVYQGDIAVIASLGWDGAIIATPNHLHREPAEECLQAGLGVMIEKPMCHTAEEAGALELLHHVYTQQPLLIGYCLRFHPGLRRAKELIDSGTIGKVRHASIHFGSYLPDWRPGTDYRTNYAASRETGGGILMDASHELDYACWLLGRPASVSCTMQNSGALQIETEDIADLVVRFESGVQASIHLDYLSREPRRECVIVCDKGTVTWDFRTGLRLYTGAPQVTPFGEWLGPREFVDPDDMYRAELSHFLACVRGEEKPLVTGEDGVRAVRIVESARKSSNTGRVVNI